MYLTCMTCCNNHFSSLSHHLPLKQPPLKPSPQVRCRVVCGSIEQSLAPLPSVPLKGPEFNTGNYHWSVVSVMCDISDSCEELHKDHSPVPKGSYNLSRSDKRAISK